MKIERVELRQIELPYVAPFETSGWRETGCHAVIVRVDADGATGWGEAPVGEAPFYNEENTKTVWTIAQDFLTPMLFQADIERAAELCQIALEHLSDDDVFLRSAVTWILSLARLADGDLEDGNQALQAQGRGQGHQARAAAAHSRDDGERRHRVGGRDAGEDAAGAGRRLQPH